MAVRHKGLQSDPLLMFVADALNLMRSCFSSRKNRRHERGEQCDDADYDQQLNQIEGVTTRL